MRDEATVLPAVKLAAQPMLQVEGVEGFEGGGLRRTHDEAPSVGTIELAGVRGSHGVWPRVRPTILPVALPLQQPRQVTL